MNHEYKRKIRKYNEVHDNVAQTLKKNLYTLDNTRYKIRL